MIRRLLSTSVLVSVLLSSVLLPSQAKASEDNPISSTRDQVSARSAKPVNQHYILGVTFDAPERFSEMQRLERDTAGIIYQGNTPNSQMVIRFAELKSDSAGWVQFSPTEQMTYARYLFLGNNNAPSGEFSQREFFGRMMTGEAQTIRTRTGFRFVEMYIVPLEKSERKIAIAFESDTLLSLATVETAINTVSESMYELNNSELKQLRKQKKQERKAQKRLEKQKAAQR